MPTEHKALGEASLRGRSRKAGAGVGVESQIGYLELLLKRNRLLPGIHNQLIASRRADETEIIVPIICIFKIVIDGKFGLLIMGVILS